MHITVLMSASPDCIVLGKRMYTHNLTHTHPPLDNIAPSHGITLRLEEMAAEIWGSLTPLPMFLLSPLPRIHFHVFIGHSTLER